MSLNLNFEIDRQRLRKRRAIIMDMDFWVRLLALMILAFFVCLFSGCTTTQDTHVVWKTPFKKKDKPQMAGAMTAIWENVYFPATGMRGLRGHLLFFADSSMKKNIRIDGMVSVYVFDDSIKDVEGLEPMRIYRFKPDAVQLHEVKTDLGYTYVFWLPFDEIGGEEMNLTLLARFDGVKGDRPEPAQTPILLTGTAKKEVKTEEFPLKSDIMQVGYASPTPPQSFPVAQQLPPTRLPAPTYDLTPALAKQIFNSPHVVTDLSADSLASGQRIASRSYYDEGFGGGDMPYEVTGNSFTDPQVGRAFVNVRNQMQQRMNDWGQIPQNVAQTTHTYPQPVQHPVQQLMHQQQNQAYQISAGVPQQNGYQPQGRLDISNNQSSFVQEKLQFPGLTPVPAHDPGLIQSPGTQVFMGQPGAAGFNPPLNSF